MKIDFDATLHTLDGGNIRLDEETTMTLKVACLEALLSGRPEDANTPGLAYRLYSLAQRVHDGGPVDMDAADVDLVKQRVEQRWAVFPNVVGAAWTLLEGRDANNALDTSA